MKIKNFESIKISKEIKNALEAGIPIVALESTIISHGMPYPQNLETAFLIEKIIREESAIPATIAIMDGNIKIGLTSNEIEKFSQNNNLLKVSRRDLPVVISQKKSSERNLWF